MQVLQETWIAIKLGGMIIVPLSLLAIIALAIMLEKAFIYWRYARLPLDLLRLAETYGFAWEDLEKRLSGFESPPFLPWLFRGA